MKTIYIFKEQIPYAEERIRAVFTDVELAYKYMLNYLDYLEIDAKTFSAGDELERELLRFKTIIARLPRILDWKEKEKKYHWFFCEGFNLIEISCYENEKDLPLRRMKKGENTIEF